MDYLRYIGFGLVMGIAIALACPAVVLMFVSETLSDWADELLD